MKKSSFSYRIPQNTLFFAGLVSLLSIGLFPNPSAYADEKYDVVVDYGKGALHEINAQFEHSGVVIVDNAGQDDDAKSLSLEVTARIIYDQRFTGNSKKRQAIRHYRKSFADIEIDKKKTESSLSDDNKLIVARIQKDASQRLQLASIANVLKQSELDLIRNPADPLAYVNLFNKEGVKTGEKWSVDSDAIADFLSVDNVYENDVQITLKSVEKNVAKVYVQGEIKAEIDDVTTEMSVSAVALIDIDKKMLKALRTTISEERSPGQVAPGFDGQTKIDIKITPQKSVKELSNHALAQTTSKRIDRRIKWEGNQFQVTFDPRWRIIASEDEAAVLRYVDEGLLLAQCNIVQLPSRKPDNPLSLSSFKAEVKKIVTGEKEKADVVTAEQVKTATDLTALRIVVEGQESKVPIRWIYYHVSADDGRCLTYVFTLEKDVADRFATADKLFVNETRFFTKVARKTGTPKKTTR